MPRTVRCARRCAHPVDVRGRQNVSAGPVGEASGACESLSIILDWDSALNTRQDFDYSIVSYLPSSVRRQIDPWLQQRSCWSRLVSS